APEAREEPHDLPVVFEVSHPGNAGVAEAETGDGIVGEEESEPEAREVGVATVVPVTGVEKGHCGDADTHAMEHGQVEAREVRKLEPAQAEDEEQGPDHKTNRLGQVLGFSFPRRMKFIEVH